MFLRLPNDAVTRHVFMSYYVWTVTRLTSIQNVDWKRELKYV